MTLLSGCVKTVYETKLEVHCPLLKVYTKEHNQKLSDELQSMANKYPRTVTTISDYIALRDQIRACESARIKNEFNKKDRL